MYTLSYFIWAGVFAFTPLWTRPLFGIFFFSWMSDGILNNWLWDKLDSLGEWSYSLYLTHLIWLKIADPHTIKAGILAIGFIYLCSYLFCLLIEKPSHQLARKL